MASAGLYMLALVAILMIATGLPAWMLLIGVAMIFSLGGLAAGAFTLPLLTAMPARLLGLLEQDLLQALPLYVFMGAMLNRLPLAEILFRVANRVFGGGRSANAGMPLAGLGLGVLLAPMNGSVGASVAMLSRAVQPKLDAAGLAPERSAALSCMASTLGVVIPPSLVLILLGDAMLRAHTEAVNATGPLQEGARIINTQDVFHGALLPAALLLVLCALIAWWMGRTESSKARHSRAGGNPASFEAAPLGPRLRGDDAIVEINTVVQAPAAAAVAPTVYVAASDWLTAFLTSATMIALLAAVALGYLYAVEAAATGGVVLFAFGLASGALSRALLMDILRDTMAVAGALFALLIAATMFTLVVRAFGTDRWIAAQLQGFAHHPRLLLLIVLGVLATCAFVLDAFEMIFVVIPLVIPPLLMQIPDAVWVAVLTLLILQASFLIPPFGYAVMMVRNRSSHHLDTGKLVRALMPWVAAQLLVLAIVVAWPGMLWRDAALSAKAPGTKPAAASESLEEMLNRQQSQEPK